MSKKRARDFALYCMIAIALAAGAVFLGVYDSDHNISSDIQIRWIAAIVFTAFVFGFVVRSAVKANLLRRRMTWGLLLALGVVHGALLLALGKITISPSVDLYAIAAMVEIPIFTFAIQKAHGQKDQRDALKQR